MEQAVTVCLPGELLQIGNSGRRTTTVFGRSCPSKPAVDARFIVISGESIELALQIDSVPEQAVIEIFPSDRAGQPFDKRVRARYKRDGLDFLDREHAQIGPPAMEAEQRVVVRTEMFRERLAGYGVVEHSTDRHAVDVSPVHAAADDPACEQIHDYRDPVALEQDGFASE